ncbi:MAG: UMP kinase [Planctomycetaceae bacterium]|nr:MAG: UMP kinase [Planctomycetaceae bacterium]
MSVGPALAPAYRRILLKLSGDTLGRPGETGISMASVESIAQQIKSVAATGVQLAIVIGGGNILRGRALSDSKVINQATAHYMGMLATVINGLALHDALESAGVPARVQSAIRMEGVAEPFIRRRCIRHLEKGRVVILAGGTGSPFVTTDTAAALRAREIDADLLLKATRVDGIYSDDPEKNPHAVRYSEITYQDMLSQNLAVMDVQAVHHCKEQNLPIIVFNFKRAGNIERVIAGERIGTRVVSSAQLGKAGE